ncbi:unnamed protein product [Spirodela intermedia]|uniref:Uncharacterized protein n=1 Tax=Spirodela intermedia TaxID=51605 RepID=A0A7I8IQE0_SPIIN|nr:unnamed protein product [Spirodela intermedia]CAA6659211.1 unnamed protein product [Spirodela intermedia]CAA6675867.1 unnamed protein product [Spirodela intermedia]
MVRLHPVQFPTGIVSNLHARGTGPYRFIIKCVGSNSCLKYSDDLGINPTFNISYIIPYHGSLNIPNELVESFPSIVSDTILKYPQPIYSPQHEHIESTLDEQVISNPSGEMRRFLVHYKGHPPSDDSWISGEDLCRLDLAVWECHNSTQLPSSLEPSSTNPGEVDAARSSPRHLRKVEPFKTEN